MNCVQTQRRLWAYLDRELTPEVQSKVQAHLEACAACAAELRRLMGQDAALAAAFAAQPQTDVTRAVLEVVAHEPVWWLDGTPAPAGWLGAALLVAWTVAALSTLLVAGLGARLLLWSSQLTGLLNPVPALWAWFGQYRSARAVTESVLMAARAGLEAIPVPVLFVAGLVLLLVQAWVASRFITDIEGGVTR